MEEKEKTDEIDEDSTKDKFEIESLALIDDIFFSVAMNNNEKLAQEILEPIFEEVLGEKLGKITSVETQVENRQLKQRGVIYDAIVMTEDKKVINLEDEKGKKFPIERSDYYEAANMVDSLKRGEKFKKLKFYHIVISNEDTIGNGKMVEVVRRRRDSDCEVVDDGKTGIYLYTGADEKEKRKYQKLSQILDDFTEGDIAKLKNPVIKETHRKFKEKGEPRMQLTKAMEKELERRQNENYSKIKKLEDKNSALTNENEQLKRILKEANIPYED